MTRTSPSALLDHFLPKLSELYNRSGRLALYQQQVDDNENNNYSYHNNNMVETEEEVSMVSSQPGVKVWQMITRNIMGINSLYSHAQKK